MTIQPGPQMPQKYRTPIYLLLFTGLVLCMGFFLTDPPPGITSKAWHVSGLLIPVIIIWATEAMPVGVASLWFLALVVAFGPIDPKVAFGGFLEQLTWLIVGAFSMAIAMEKTGLSKRITYFLLMKAKGFWGIVGAAYLANLLMLAIPSSSARSGILAPVVNIIMETAGRPGKSNFSRLLTYHFCMATNASFSLAFLTGGAANVVMLGLYSKLVGPTLTWNQWFVVMFLPVLVFTAIILFGSTLWGKPEPEFVEKIKSGVAMRRSYESLGPMKREEWKVLGALILVVVLWISGERLGLKPGFAALIVMGLLFLPGVGVLSQTALKEINWNIVLQIATVMGLGGILNDTDLTKILADRVVAPVMDPFASLGLAGIGIAAILINRVIHFITPSPNNVTLAVSLLLSWGLSVHLPTSVILTFLAMLSLMSDKIILLSYQMPPYYIFLGMNVTDIPRFNALLIRMFPIASLAMIIASFIVYWMVLWTGFGI